MYVHVKKGEKRWENSVVMQVNLVVSKREKNMVLNYWHHQSIIQTDRFKVEDGNIRYSLLAIKNVGYAGYKAIEAERQNGTFKDIFDFVSRMESSKLNSKMLDSLIMAGAFDEFKLNRTTIKQNLHKIMEYAELKNSIGIDEPPILTIVRDNRIKVLEEEKMVLGVYLTMHPIALIKNNLKEQIVNLNELSNYIDQPVRVIMALSRVKVIVDKKDKRCALLMVTMKLVK